MRRPWRSPPGCHPSGMIYAQIPEKLSLAAGSRKNRASGTHPFAHHDPGGVPYRSPWSKTPGIRSNPSTQRTPEGSHIVARGRRPRVYGPIPAPADPGGVPARTTLIIYQIFLAFYIKYICILICHQHIYPCIFIWSSVQKTGNVGLKKLSVQICMPTSEGR